MGGWVQSVDVVTKNRNLHFIFIHCCNGVSWVGGLWFRVAVVHALCLVAMASLLEQLGSLVQWSFLWQL
jgi:hypothetical protein